MSIKAILWESPEIQEISIKWLFLLPYIRKKLPAAGFRMRALEQTGY